jgi:hypothetical protein
MYVVFKLYSHRIYLSNFINSNIARYSDLEYKMQQLAKFTFTLADVLVSIITLMFL